MSKDWIEFEEIRVGDHLRVEEDREFKSGPLRGYSGTSEGVVTSVNTFGERSLVIERDGEKRVILVDRPDTQRMDFCRLSKPREVGYWKVADEAGVTVYKWTGDDWQFLDNTLSQFSPSESARLTYIGRGDM